MSHHNNDVCGKSALTYKDSAEGLAEARVVRRQGVGLRTARYLPSWPEQGRPGAGSFGEESLDQISCTFTLGFKPVWSKGYETCRLCVWGGPSPFHFFPRRTPRLKASSLFVAELLVDM